MCEPNHSIVQFQESDRPRFSRVLGPVVNLGKRIRNWFHLCKMGAGHSLAMEVNGLREFYLPHNNKWEVAWWIRQLNADEINYDKDDAEIEALEYANRVSIGNLSLFRRFFEQSVLKSDRPGMYLSQFRHMLNVKGRDAYEKKLKLAKLENVGYAFVDKVTQHQIQSAINLALGFTRKRNLLVPEWADDDRLWVPSKTLSIG